MTNTYSVKRVEHLADGLPSFGIYLAGELGLTCIALTYTEHDARHIAQLLQSSTDTPAEDDQVDDLAGLQ